MVQLELAKWMTREGGESGADEVIAFTRLCRVVPLDTEIAIHAADACLRLKLPTADAVIFATARLTGATLITCEAHFGGLEGVILVPKTGA